MTHPLVGKSYAFDDGSLIEVIQVKAREDGHWVTYQTSINSSLPRKLLLPLVEFDKTFGHLFEDKE